MRLAATLFAFLVRTFATFAFSIAFYDRQLRKQRREPME